MILYRWNHKHHKHKLPSPLFAIAITTRHGHYNVTEGNPCTVYTSFFVKG
eukprot:m.256410 g.256410  ORF g.256410 m.256410 type:complete len:50 (-) comp15519_c0_seq7:381-530(-)